MQSSKHGANSGADVQECALVKATLSIVQDALTPMMLWTSRRDKDSNVVSGTLGRSSRTVQMSITNGCPSLSGLSFFT